MNEFIRNAAEKMTASYMECDIFPRQDKVLPDEKTIEKIKDSDNERALQYNIDLKDKLTGSVKFIFQPAEEVNNGAKYMIEKGCLENPKVDAVFGIHNSPEIPLGTVAVKNSPLMASVDRIVIKIKGKVSAT